MSGFKIIQASGSVIRATIILEKKARKSSFVFLARQICFRPDTLLSLIPNMCLFYKIKKIANKKIYLLTRIMCGWMQRKCLVPREQEFKNKTVIFAIVSMFYLFS